MLVNIRANRVVLHFGECRMFGSILTYSYILYLINVMLVNLRDNRLVVLNLWECRMFGSMHIKSLIFLLPNVEKYLIALVIYVV